MKRVFLLVSLLLLFSPMVFVGAQNSADDPFVLIPESTNPQNDANNSLLLGDKRASGTFWQKYNTFADDNSDNIGGQFASGIMNRDTILGLLSRVVIFLANGALVVGAAMIIYAGYLYVASVFAGDYTSQAHEAIKRAVIGIVIVIFSYSIVRVVIHAFL